jgi:NAD(P)H-hydrate epimerase
VLPFADAALAKAGSGDVLAGVIVALLAQSVGPYEAAMVGGYAHALAGVKARQLLGAISTTAEDLVNALPESLQSLSTS